MLNWNMCRKSFQLCINVAWTVLYNTLFLSALSMLWSSLRNKSGQRLIKSVLLRWEVSFIHKSRITYPRVRSPLWRNVLYKVSMNFFEKLYMNEILSSFPSLCPFCAQFLRCVYNVQRVKYFCHDVCRYVGESTPGGRPTWWNSFARGACVLTQLDDTYVQHDDTGTREPRHFGYSDCEADQVDSIHASLWANWRVCRPKIPSLLVPKGWIAARTDLGRRTTCWNIGSPELFQSDPPPPVPISGILVPAWSNNKSSSTSRSAI